MARVMALDVGEKTIGVAVSDESETFAFPRETIQRQEGHRRDMAALRQIIETDGIEEIVVGMPIMMNRMAWLRRLSIRKPTDPINFATARAVTNLTNSEGCTPKAPTTSQALFQPTSFPINGTSSSKNIVAPKIT